MKPDALELAKVAFPAVGGALVTALWSWWSRRTEQRSPANMVGAAADLQRAANDAVEQAISRLTDEVAALRRRVEDLERENEDCLRKGHEAQQLILSLAQVLEANGIPLPEAFAPGAFLTVEGGKATVVHPSSDRRRRGRS